MQSPMYRKNELSYYKLKGFYTNSVEEVNSHITEKIWERQKKTPSDGLLKMLTVKQKCVDFPKYGKIEFPIYRKSLEKNKHSKVTGFLMISGEAEIHTIPETWGKMNFHNTAKG